MAAPYTYLSKEQLTGFDKYKYSCKDTSYLSIYVMHPFWNWLVQFCPPYVAPNVLTFTGFLFTVLICALFTYLDYDFSASDPDAVGASPLPTWALWTAALLLFLAYTLDGIDGKQARRTGTSGPLGELFDHGLDSYTAGLLPIVCYSIFSRGERFSIPPMRMYFVLWNILINFWLPHWEKYNTGVLFLPWGYDFSMWGTVFMFVAAAACGTDMWQVRFSDGLTAVHLFEIGVHLFGALTNVPVVAYNVYQSYRHQTGYQRSPSEALRPFLPIGCLFVIMLVWLLNSPCNIIERDPRIVYVLVGTIFSNICCRLIVAQMSSTRCDAHNVLLLPTLTTIVIALWTQNAQLELAVTYVLCGLVTLAHIHYGTYLVQQMCSHFGIYCFRIKEPSD